MKVKIPTAHLGSFKDFGVSGHRIYSADYWETLRGFRQWSDMIRCVFRATLLTALGGTEEGGDDLHSDKLTGY